MEDRSMNAYFCNLPEGSIRIRRALLERSLRAFLQKQGNIHVRDLVDSGSPLSDIESLSVFAKPKGRSVSYFVGLPNAPLQMLGRNILILTRSLADELRDFDRRNRGEETGSEYWVRNILQNFDKVILLERLQFSQSVSFAPYARLLLSDRFPVLGWQARSSQRRILVFDHNNECGRENVMDFTGALRSISEVVVIRPETEAGVNESLLPSADVHIHVNFSFSSPTAALTPFDSLTGGIYTIVMSETDQAGVGAGSVLIEEINKRSYGKSASSFLEAIASCKEFIERANLMWTRNMVINPETHRFQRINDQYIETCLREFKETLV